MMKKVISLTLGNDEVSMWRYDTFDGYMVCVNQGFDACLRDTYEEAYKELWKKYDTMRIVHQHEANVKHGWHNMLQDAEDELEARYNENDGAYLL